MPRLKPMKYFAFDAITDHAIADHAIPDKSPWRRLLHRLPALVISSSLLLCLGCSGYRVTVNEQSVYDPAPLFSDYKIADAALRACVDQTLADQRINAAKDLLDLSCSYGGIETLQGLQVFSGLTRVDLSHNNLTSVELLFAMPQLAYLNLEANENLACREATTLSRSLADAAVVLPEHCRNK